MVQLHGWLCTVSADKEEWILQVLDKTFCSDEFFVQTLIVQSPYQDKIYQGRVIPVPVPSIGTEAIRGSGNTLIWNS